MAYSDPGKVWLIAVGVTLLAAILVVVAVPKPKPPRLQGPVGDGFLCERKFAAQHNGKEATIPYCANVDMTARNGRSYPRSTNLRFPRKGRSRRAPTTTVIAMA
jgi:hypothetical protein